MRRFSFNMINAKKKLWRWGPIDGRPVYPDPWYDGMTENLKLFSPGWPDGYSLYKKDRYSYICEYEPLYKQAEIIFTKYILDKKKKHKIYEQWLGIVKRLIIFNKKITPVYLQTLSNKDLYELVRDWYNLYSKEFWGVGLLPEIANFGGEGLLKKIVGTNSVALNEQVSVIEKLSAPVNYSFYAQEELDLYKLRRLNGVALSKALDKHQHKYFWILNSYHDTKILPVKYFAGRLNKLSIKQASDKIRNFQKQIQSAKSLKNKLVRQYKLPKETLNIAHELANCIWWQDNRKSYIFQTNHIIDVILNEISRRFKVSKNHLHYYVFKDLLKLIKSSKKLSDKEINKRLKYFAIIWQGQDGTVYLAGNKAKSVYDMYQAASNLKNVKQIRGEAVSSGVVKGKVRVILSARDINTLRKGEILVTTMTSPDFVVGMKKAKAVITDVGGITSHAAIVSRELDIPCVVGTHHATKFFKNGDMVEVNGLTGEISKL